MFSSGLSLESSKAKILLNTEDYTAVNDQVLNNNMKNSGFLFTLIILGIIVIFAYKTCKPKKHHHDEDNESERSMIHQH